MKKKLALILCLLLCIGVCFACADSEYLGVYKTSGLDSTYYLELKSGDKCEFYILNKNQKKEDVKGVAGADYYEGTYKIDDTKITVYIVNTNTINNQTEEIVGTILDNNRINLQWEDGSQKVFKKQ